MNNPPVLDPSDYTIVPHVCVIDEFQMTNDDGSFAANITPVFLDRLCDHMNGRESATGDLSPIVIGHTEDDGREVDGPPLVGWARNWHRGVLGSTGRQAAFVDAWIRNDKVQLARDYPRRSSEVWVNRFEIDPISLLGATTPARDLGLMRLSREGSLTFISPGEPIMPEDKKPDADSKNTGESKGIEGKLDQLMQMISQLIASQAKPAAAAPPGEGDKAGEPNDADLDALLASLGGGDGPGAGAPVDDKSRKGEPEPVKNDAASDIPERLSRIESENAELRAKLSRSEVKDALIGIRGKGRDVDPEDEGLVADLVAQPVDMRIRSLDRIEKLSRPLPGRTQTGLNDALRHAAPAPDGRKRMTVEDRNRLMKLALSRKTSFDVVAESEGFTPGI